MEQFWIGIAGLSGAAAVAADATARHALAGDPFRGDLAATAARYGLVHAAALLALAMLLRAMPEGAARRWSIAAGWCFVAAQLLFCGGLYLHAAGSAALVPLVPVGGTLFIAGWAALFLAAVWPRPAV